MNEEWRISAHEQRIKKLEDGSDASSGCGCLVVAVIVALLMWDSWTGGAAMRFVLRPWVGQ